MVPAGEAIREVLLAIDGVSAADPTVGVSAVALFVAPPKKLPTAASG